MNTLMQHNLIDVYRIRLYPLTLGTGERYLADGADKSTLTLTGATTTSTGVVVLTYEASGNGFRVAA